MTGGLILGAVACSGDQVRRGLSEPVSSSPDAVLAELRSEKERIDRITDEMMERIDAYNQAARPGQRQIRFSEIFHDDLSGEQQDVLNAMLAGEKDVSYRALLQQLIDDRDTMRRLQERILRLEQRLPDEFVVAQQGENQYDLAMEYLTSGANLPPEKAKRLLAEVDLSDELLPGNKVWFFYDVGRDTFRTYVTRGDAGQTPLAIRRAVKRNLISERDAALARAAALEVDLHETRTSLETEIASLSAELEDLSRRRWRLEEDISDLARSEADLEEKVTRLSSDLASIENSVFFHVASERELREQGALTAIRKRFHDARDLPFDHAVDLRESRTITLNAADFDIDQIKKVRLLPSVYQIERDYVVERSEDGTTASVILLDPDLFRGKEVLLSVRG